MAQVNVAHQEADVQRLEAIQLAVSGDTANRLCKICTGITAERASDTRFAGAVLEGRGLVVVSGWRPGELFAYQLWRSP